MIDVKEAVSSARAFLLNLYEGQRLNNLLLEEVQLETGGKHWSITFGFDTDSQYQIDYAGYGRNKTPPTYVRAYKIISVDAETGQAESMRIRQI